MMIFCTFQSIIADKACSVKWKFGKQGKTGGCGLNFRAVSVLAKKIAIYLGEMLIAKTIPMVYSKYNPAWYAYSTTLGILRQIRRINNHRTRGAAVWRPVVKPVTYFYGDGEAVSLRMQNSRSQKVWQQ
ncbi:MAG: hypothetical protein ACI3VZ_04580 [Faecousia sp.]